MPITVSSTVVSAYPPSRTAGLNPWQAGQSGNPNGRPKGRRNIPSLIREAVTEEEAIGLVRMALQKANEGSTYHLEWLARYELADIARNAAEQPQVVVNVLQLLRELPTEIVAMLAGLATEGDE